MPQMRTGCLPFLLVFVVSGGIASNFGNTVGGLFFWPAVGVLLYYRWNNKKQLKKLNVANTTEKESKSPPLRTTSPALKPSNVVFKQATRKPPLCPPHSDGVDYSKPPERRKTQTKIKTNTKTYIAPQSRGVSARRIKFTYENAQGEISERDVRFEHVNSVYIRGYCYLAKDERTFRIDRIDGLIEQAGEFFAVDEWLVLQGVKQRHNADKKAKAKTKPQKAEICFTGFGKNERYELEVLAELSGFAVRKSVTKNLSFLVIGDNAGKSKIADAKTKGVKILTVYDFRNMIETGEIPE